MKLIATGLEQLRARPVAVHEIAIEILDRLTRDGRQSAHVAPDTGEPLLMKLGIELRYLGRGRNPMRCYRELPGSAEHHGHDGTDTSKIRCHLGHELVIGPPAGSQIGESALKLGSTSGVSRGVELVAACAERPTNEGEQSRCPWVSG
jgi:hypothetical protein